MIIIAGCSVKRNILPSTRDSGLENSSRLMVSDVAELNFTAQPFFIQRADINIGSGNESQRVNAMIRFAQPDSFLISVRVFAGIEVARILLTSDSILVNDRINRTLYYGSNQNLEKKYGFDLMFFPVLLGDLITGTQVLSGVNCEDGKAVLREFRTNYIVNFFIDCETKKCMEVTVENEFDKEYISIEFANFANDGKMIFPRRIKTNNFANLAFFEMIIERVEFGAGSNIEFIPGRNYERVELK